MLFLDTTVLMYAQVAEHEYRDPCRELVAAISDSHVRATTTVEVIQEFAHVRGRRCGRDSGAEHARDYAVLLAPLFTVDSETLDLGLSIYERHDRLGAFDAVLAAAAITSAAVALVSADRAFADVARLRHVTPDQAGISALLAAGG
jgi:uncharacterized protein